MNDNTSRIMILLVSDYSDLFLSKIFDLDMALKDAWMQIKFH